jgi:Flp pilus assembly protein TadG
MRHRARSRRNQKGAEIAEFAAGVLLVVPIFILMVYATYEASMYMYLKTGVDAAARTEARWLAINFNYLVQRNGNSAGNYANWKNSSVRVANCVTSDVQMTNGTIDSAGNFVTTAPPVLVGGQCLTSAAGQGSVAVRVVYPGGNGLPAWPNPPLSFFGMKLMPTNMTIAGVYVADIEP